MRTKPLVIVKGKGTRAETRITTSITLYWGRAAGAVGERTMTKHCPDCTRPMHRNAAGWWCACGKRIMDLPKGYKKQKKVKR